MTKFLALLFFITSMVSLWTMYFLDNTGFSMVCLIASLGGLAISFNEIEKKIKEKYGDD